MLADSIVELQKRENTTIPFLQKQLGEVERRISNLLNAIEEGLMNASAKERLDDLEAKKAELEVSLVREKIEKTPLTKEQIVFWIDRFKDGNVDDPEYRRSLVDIFVNLIFLYDDKLVIAFNWKDGSKTVSLAELEGAAEGDGSISETAKIRKALCSHLDDNRPPSTKPKFNAKRVAHIRRPFWYSVGRNGYIQGIAHFPLFATTDAPGGYTAPKHLSRRGSASLRNVGMTYGFAICAADRSGTKSSVCQTHC